MDSNRKKFSGHISTIPLMILGSMNDAAHASSETPSTGIGSDQLVPVILQIVAEMGNQIMPNTFEHPNPAGDTWFQYAVRTGNIQMVQYFLRNSNLDINAQNAEGDTALMLAIKGGGNDDFRQEYQEIFDLLI
ncbi:MAG: ankyrin repeat domain-containing protein [Puniceicoccales bacterium]|jgi:hypothetical protein|nr:ankyrin repeat domain-containing protein [Puniceicoccales bacterium]